MLTDLSATDAFEADSEGSDNERVPKITISGSTTSYSSYSDGPPTIMSPNKGEDSIIVMADQNGKLVSVISLIESNVTLKRETFLINTTHFYLNFFR